MVDRDAAIHALITIGQMLHGSGIFRARAGNLSCRLDDGTVLITRARTHKGMLQSSDFVLLASDGTPLEDGEASSEVALHIAAYTADARIGAVGHAHPLACTELTHRGVALAVALAEEGQPVLGTPPLLDDLPRETRTAAWHAAVVAGNRAALLRHHGLVVAGADARDVLCKMELAEWIATLQINLHHR